MPNFDLILPWIACGLTLFVFFAVRRWVQRHLFGMGWLVAQEQHLATVIYCIVLLPGIIIHEASHWALAGMFNVRTHRITAWPKADAEGRVDLSFIKIKETANPIFLAVIGSAPFVIGFVLILWISGNVLHLPDFIKAVNTGNFQVISLALQNLIGQPDFVLWFYLLFTISNTLWPEAEDRRGWIIIIGVVVGGTVLLAVMGFQNAVGRWFTGPIPQALNNLTTIFLTMLVIDGVVALFLFILERSTERVTHRYAPYRQATALVAAKNSKAAANAPRLSSILQYQLPLPSAPRKADRPAVAAGGESGAAAAPGLPRPAEAPSGLPSGSGTRPGLPPSTAPSRPVPSTPAVPAFGMSSAPGAGAPRPALASSATDSPNSSRPGSPLPGGAGSGVQSAPSLRPATATGTMPPVTSPAGGSPGFSSRPALPASTSTPGSPGGGALTPMSGSPRPPIGTSGPPPASTAPRSGIFGAASPNRTEDYIDAEVIEDDDPASNPTGDSG
jgi:hypothetical protein